MKTANDVMEPALVVPPDLSVPELARRLVEHDADGACVVDDGQLVGVVTAMDLVFRQKDVHPPTVIALLDLVIQLGSHRTREELAKIGATDVSGLMTRAVYSVRPTTPMSEIATRMVEDHLSLVPVTDGGVLRGAVSRRSVVVATLRTVAGLK